MLEVQEPGEEAVFEPGAEPVIDWLDQVSELLKGEEFNGATLSSHKASEIEVLMERLSALVLEGVPRWRAPSIAGSVDLNRSLFSGVTQTVAGQVASTGRTTGNKRRESKSPFNGWVRREPTNETNS